MNYYLSHWDTKNNQKVKYLEKNIDKVSELVIMAVNECECNPILRRAILVAKKHNVPCHILIGGHISNDNFDYGYGNVIVWPTYWLTETLCRLLNHCNTNINGELGYNLSNSLNPNTNFDKLFITMNKRPRFHRALFIDLLYHHNLFDYGNITWREKTISYNFRYWPQQEMLLDQPNKHFLFNQEQVPKQYVTSFIQVVPETFEDRFFLTEKTCIPLIFGKPFLVVGSQNFHKILTEFGFKLYDEIFDYSFDSIDDIEQRYIGLIQNLINLKDQNYIELYNKIKDKLMYNKNLAIQIARDNSKFPEYWNKLSEVSSLNLIPHPYGLKNALQSFK